MSLQNAAVLIMWVREELGGQLYLEPARGQPPGWYFIRLRAPALRNRRARSDILAALNRNGADVVHILKAEQREHGPTSAGAEMVDWCA
jgi:hypothetical protein